MRANKTGDYLTYSKEELQATMEQLQSLDAPMTAVALHHVLKQKTTGSMIIGASNTEQLLETIEAYNTEVSEEMLLKAREITKQDMYTEHRI